jgi:hypothetical protein
MIFGAIGIVAGVAAAASARRFPAHEVQLEQWGGGLFILGLALVGLGLPML